jgi:Zn-finger nucleic acid-binding protein
MTTETRTTIQLSDIRAVEFECRECRCRIVRPVGGTQPLLLNCPECNTTWAQYRGNMEILVKMLSQLPKVAAFDSDAQTPFMLRLEISADKKP